MARSRPGKRTPPSAGLLVLPAVVLGVLCGAFLIWFLIGAPEFTVTPWADSPVAPARVAVQAPQMANTPPLPPLRSSTIPTAAPAAASPPPPPPPPQIQQPAAARPAADSMALALQPMPQISTPAALRSVMGEPQQIGEPQPVAPPAPKRAATPPAQPPMAAAAAPQPKPTPASAAPTAPVAAPPSEPAPPAADSEQPARRNFSVVLARVETEGEARAKLGPLKQRFAAALGGRRLNYHRVKEGGAYVWRVRSPGLTEDDATEICEKIESAGGDCSAVAQ